jgi:hypothetical protein
MNCHMLSMCTCLHTARHILLMGQLSFIYQLLHHALCKRQLPIILFNPGNRNLPYHKVSPLGLSTPCLFLRLQASAGHSSLPKDALEHSASVLLVIDEQWVRCEICWPPKCAGVGRLSPVSNFYCTLAQLKLLYVFWLDFGSFKWIFRLCSGS